jgi:hypothetical protein
MYKEFFLDNFLIFYKKNSLQNLIFSFLLLMMDDSVQYAGHWYCIAGPRDNANPVMKGLIS